MCSATAAGQQRTRRQPDDGRQLPERRVRGTRFGPRGGGTRGAVCSQAASTTWCWWPCIPPPPSCVLPVCANNCAASRAHTSASPAWPRPSTLVTDTRGAAGSPPSYMLARRRRQGYTQAGPSRASVAPVFLYRVRPAAPTHASGRFLSDAVVAGCPTTTTTTRSRHTTSAAADVRLHAGVTAISVASAGTHPSPRRRVGCHACCSTCCAARCCELPRPRAAAVVVVAVQSTTTVAAAATGK